MSSDECKQWAQEFEHWLNRVRDTHDSVRFTVGHRLRDWERAETVSVEVVVAMLKRPRVFRYQGLPYSGRIGTVAETILATDVDKKLSQPDWPTLVDYLLAMPLNLQPVHVAAFVHGLSDEQIADAIGGGTDNASAMRTDIEDYLARAGEAAC